jgi:cell division protease FtsH
MAENDDYDDNSIEAVETTNTVVTGRLTVRRAATHSIPDLMLRRALTAEQEQKLRRDKTTCMVVLAPNAEWVGPLLRAGKALGEWRFNHSASEPPRKVNRGDVAAEQAIFAMSGGGRILGVTQDLEYLPKAMIASADILLKIEPPGVEILREAIKLATGRMPRSLPAELAQGLDYGDVCGAIRIGSTAKACVDRLVAAGKAKTMVTSSSGGPDVPPLEALHGYGEAMTWAQSLLTDLDAWRAGKLDFSSIERTAVLASAPGLGKTTFARSLAKSAGLPFFPTSVSAWFSNSAGYLDSVIKQIDQVFAEAAAVAPAVIFLDECEGLPSRSASDRNSSWWIPVVGHMLLKLDSAASGVTSKLIIIGATNHPEKLDPALVRPGRLSKIIHIEKPDASALTGIIRQHLGSDLPDIDLNFAAKMAVGASGADVHGWVKAARRVARQVHRPLEFEDLISQIVPPEIRPPSLVRRIAVHEAAHAVASHVLRPGSVNAVTIIGGDAKTGGLTLTTIDDGDLLTRSDIEASAITCLAGRCGEQALLDSISTGSGGGHTSDLARASYMLAMVHTALGLGGKLLHRATPQTVMQLLTLDPVLAKVVEDDLQRLHAKALALVENHADIVEAVADALVKHRHLNAEQFAAVFEKASRNGMVMITGGSNG